MKEKEQLLNIMDEIPVHCTLDGVPYYSREAIGRFLGYNKPGKAMSRIMKKNPHLRDFETDLDGVKIYNTVGVFLISGCSDKPKAVQLSIALARLSAKSGITAMLLGIGPEPPSAA